MLLEKKKMHFFIPWKAGAMQRSFKCQDGTLVLYPGGHGMTETFFFFFNVFILSKLLSYRNIAELVQSSHRPPS